MNYEEIIENCELEMGEVIENYENHITKFRTGRANASLLEKVMVNLYGAPTQLTHMSQISYPDPQQLFVKPYDHSLVKEVASAIAHYNSGLNLSVEGNGVRVKVPPLTEDTRKTIAKELNKDTEGYRVQVRNKRRHFFDQIKKIDNLPEGTKISLEEEVDKLTKKFINEIDKIFKAKEKEILSL
ncbi:ribosome recycling factor [Spiroplasma endosymbiont of Crioceris asparagi]|uniref:ribosome recycling factor n=1 Tax=Spiroplasma endosymbiont of Crioceris asparagi TaxID=3066286 RepID=UPI0030CBE8BA